MSKKKEPVPVWTTKDGRKIPINKMSDKHLLYAYRHLEKLGIDYEDMCKYQFDPVWGPQGEMAQEAFESEMLYLEKKVFALVEAKQALKKEIESRGLTPLPQPEHLNLPKATLVLDLGYGKLYKLG